jgi:ABC-type transporter Mla subunit MlaD
MTIDERVEFLFQSAESHDRQIGELVSRVDTLVSRVDILVSEMDNLVSQMNNLVSQTSVLTGNVQKLVDVSNQDATAIRALARIAETHEQRISRLEGGRS